ncbi:hypothetical protein EAF04_007981 [Stromatinia cepivora]|nr:hypothetical protein EAF04_007981 [Stromatinia cepivora]
MESVVLRLDEDDLNLLEDALAAICDYRTTCTPQPAVPSLGEKRERSIDSSSDQSTQRNIRQYRTEKSRSQMGYGIITPPESQIPSNAKLFAEVKTILQSYASFFIRHPHLSGATTGERQCLHTELEAFLSAHIVQIRNNTRLASQNPKNEQGLLKSSDPKMSYYSWAHTIASNHISAPLSFSFYTCLLGSSGKSDGFSGLCSAYEEYLAQELSSYLAIMSRLYDFSSIVVTSVRGI